MEKPFVGPDKRAGEDRREFCPMHMTQVQTLASQDSSIKAIKWMVGLFCVAALSMCITMIWISMGIDKTFSQYMASHKVESSHGFDLINGNKQEIEENNDDIYLLFEGHRDQERRLTALEKSYE